MTIAAYRVTSVTHAITVVTPSACDARNAPVTSVTPSGYVNVTNRWRPDRYTTSPFYLPHLFTFTHIYLLFNHSLSNFQILSYKYPPYLSSYTTNHSIKYISSSYLLLLSNHLSIWRATKLSEISSSDPKMIIIKGSNSSVSNSEASNPPGTLI